MPHPGLSIVVTWANRSRELEILASARELLQQGSTELVIVTADSGLESYIRSTVSARVARTVRVIYLRDVVFNKCKFINIGIYHSLAETVFLCDGDIRLSGNIAHELLSQVTDETFVVIKYGIETDPPLHLQVLRDISFLKETVRTTRLGFSCGRQATYEFRQTATSRSASGLLLARRENLLKVEGCNGGLDGWGFEDVDLQIRLQVALGLSPLVLGQVMHVTHISEDQAVKSASSQKNTDRCFDRYNAGNFDGTYLEDVRWYLATQVPHRQTNKSRTTTRSEPIGEGVHEVSRTPAETHYPGGQ